MADEIVKNDQTGGQSGAGASGAPKQPTDEEVRLARLAQLDKDIADRESAKKLADDELKRIRAEKRTEKKEVKAQTPIPAPQVPEEVRIDESAPEAQAWIKRINQSVSPVTEELEKEKSEIRSFAISKFLEGKPSLAKNPEKLKELMAVYERSHVASERTVEGVLIDLERSYAYTHAPELLDAARQTRVDEARRNAIYSDIAISRGSTGYAAPQEQPKEYSDEEKAILTRWGQSAAFPKIEEKKSSKA